MEKNNDLGLLPMAENDYGFDFSFPAEQSQMPYDNKGACDELSKDMKRRDVLSCASTRTRIPAMRACRWNQKRRPVQATTESCLICGTDAVH